MVCVLELFFAVFFVCVLDLCCVWFVLLCVCFVCVLVLCFYCYFRDGVIV